MWYRYSILPQLTDNLQNSPNLFLDGRIDQNIYYFSLKMFPLCLCLPVHSNECHTTIFVSINPPYKTKCCQQLLLIKIISFILIHFQILFCLASGYLFNKPEKLTDIQNYFCTILYSVHTSKTLHEVSSLGKFANKSIIWTGLKQNANRRGC